MKEANEIHEELKALKSALGTASRKMPYATPEGYFDPLAARLSEGAIAEDSIEESIPLPKALPFTVPETYFEQLPQQLLTGAKAAEKHSGKGRIIALQPQSRRLIRFAAAAVLALGLSLGSYRYYSLHTPDGKAAHQLAKVDPDTLNSYVMQHADEFDDETLENAVAFSHTDIHAAVSSLDETEIEEYLNDSGEAMPQHYN